jgi:hypothetical protein
MLLSRQPESKFPLGPLRTPDLNFQTQGQKARSSRGANKEKGEEKEGKGKEVERKTLQCQELKYFRSSLFCLLRILQYIKTTYTVLLNYLLDDPNV